VKYSFKKNAKITAIKELAAAVKVAEELTGKQWFIKQGSLADLSPCAALHSSPKIPDVVS